MRGARQNKGERPWPERIDQHARRARHRAVNPDRKSTRLNSSHQIISYAVFCLKKKNRHSCKTIDIIEDKDIIHNNKAARHKSRLAAALKRCLPAANAFFFDETSSTDIYTLSLHDALPI